MAWFWEKKKEEKDKEISQEAASKAKRGLLQKSTSNKKTDSKKSKASATAPKAAKPFAAHGLILGPVVTEKAARLAEEGTFVFEVSSRANKITVAKAIASLYNVHPVHVNMMTKHGKPKMFAQRAGRRASFRKAYVTLRKGEHIELFEEAPATDDK